MRIHFLRTIALVLLAAASTSAESPQKEGRGPATRSDGSDLRMVYDTGYRSGYINRAGKVIVEPQFEDADEFFEGRARVSVDGKWGYIGPTGRFVVPPTYDCAENFSEGLARVTVGKKYGYIDKNGRIAVPIKFAVHAITDAPIFRSGLAPAPNPDGEGRGYIDRRGRMVIAPCFLSAQPFSEGLACVRVSTESGPKSGFIDTKGRMVIPAIYDACRQFAGGRAWVLLGEWDTGTYKLIDRSGRVVIELKYTDVSSFSDGLAAIGAGGFTLTHGLSADVGAKCPSYPRGKPGAGHTQLGKIGYIDISGKYVIAPTWTYAGEFSEGLAPVRTEQGWGYIDKTGRMVITPQFESAGSFFHGLARVHLSGRHNAVIDRSGRIVWSAP